MVLGDTRISNSSPRDRECLFCGSSRLKRRCDSGSIELIPHLFNRHTFPSMDIVRTRKRMHVSETIQAVIGKALQSPHALQMNWFKGTIPAEMLCGVHPCRHHIRDQNTLAQEAQTGTCHQEVEVSIVTTVPTLADLQEHVTKK